MCPVPIKNFRYSSYRLLLTIIILFLIGCTTGNSSTPTEVAISSTATQPPTPTATATPSPTATQTPIPTNTPTPSPTATLMPTPTAGPLNLTAHDTRLITVPKTGLGITYADTVRLNDLDLDPSDSYLAIASNQGLLIYDMASLTLLQAVSEDGSTKKSVSWSPDGDMVIVGSGPRVWVWDFANEKTLFEFSGHGVEMRHVEWSPLPFMATSVANNGSFAIWDPIDGVPITDVSPPFGIRTTAFSPDGQLLALGEQEQIYIFNLTAFESDELPIVHTDTITSISWYPRGDLLVSGGDEGQLIVWSSESAKVVRELEGHKDAILDVAWSPRGNYIASVSADLTTLVWDTSTWEPVFKLRGHSDSIISVDWSADGRFLLTGSVDGTVRIWELPE